MDSCDAFSAAVREGIKEVDECPYYLPQEPPAVTQPCGSCALDAAYTGADVTNAPYDFIITAFPGSCRSGRISLKDLALQKAISLPADQPEQAVRSSM